MLAGEMRFDLEETVKYFFYGFRGDPDSVIYDKDFNHPVITFSFDTNLAAGVLQALASPYYVEKYNFAMGVLWHRFDRDASMLGAPYPGKLRTLPNDFR